MTGTFQSDKGGTSIPLLSHPGKRGVRVVDYGSLEKRPKGTRCSGVYGTGLARNRIPALKAC